MDKANVYDLDGNKKGTIDLPSIFNVKPRKDLIHKATEVSFSKNKQIQGRDKRAGSRTARGGGYTGRGTCHRGKDRRQIKQGL